MSLSPTFGDSNRKVLEAKGLVCSDLNDFARLLDDNASPTA